MDSTSLKSTTSSKPRTPGIEPSGKRVGFARPTLIIPPAQQQKYAAYAPGLLTPGSVHTMGSYGTPRQGMYGRKASLFMNKQFIGIRDFTMSTAKSGMGIGEKCSYWCYGKIKLLSKKWFTHCFLSIVITLYTIGGALLFVYIEGHNEEVLKHRDLHDDRYKLIRILRNLSITLPQKTTVREWEGKASLMMLEYEEKIVNYYKNDALIMDNRGTKIWTMWNAIVYCATVYTTLVGMASQPTSRDTIENDQVDIEKIKSLLTEDQVISDNVARRRRRFTKKRSTSLTKRDLTPIRKLDEKTTSDEEVVNRKPKTPERPRRPNRNKSLYVKNQSETDSPSIESNDVSRTNSFRSKLKAFEEKVRAKSDHEEGKPKKRFDRRSEERKKSLSDLAQEELYSFFKKIKDGRTKRQKSLSDLAQEELYRSEETQQNLYDITDLPNEDKKPIDVSKRRFTRRSEERKKSLSDLAQEEVVALFTKTKKSITNAAIKGRDRFRKDKELVKRSQSAPNKIDEQELIESFKKAQFEGYIDNKPRKYSEPIIVGLASPIIKKAKAIKPGIRQRKIISKYSAKVVEILDPTSRNVISRKTVMKLPEVGIKDLFKILKFYSIREIYKEYQKYKIEMKIEYNRIKFLWNKCIFELFLIMMFCGAGGFLFKFIEGQFENFYKCGVKRVKRDFIDLLWMKSHNLREEDWKSLFRNKLRVFEEELHVAHEAGMTTYSGQRSWSFLNGIVYALSIVTTIGYGHIYPTTTTGMALTIVYAIVGIPLFLIALTDFGKLFTRGIKFLWSFVRRLYYTGSCRNVRKSAQVTEIFKGAQFMYDMATFRRPSNISNEEHPDKKTDPGTPATITITPTTPDLSNFEIDDEFNLPISVALFILVAYMFIGAVIYCAWERWQFFESFYFVFISLSTVGFGDYVPRNPICMIVSIVYLVFGLALMSMCINVVQVKLSDTFQHASLKLSSTMGFEGPGEEDDLEFEAPLEEGQINAEEGIESSIIEAPKIIDGRDVKPENELKLENEKPQYVKET